MLTQGLLPNNRLQPTPDTALFIGVVFATFNLPYGIGYDGAAEAGTLYELIQREIREKKMYQCPVEYEPEKRYTRREMIELIKVQRQLLCFFAQMSGYRRCVLGLEFEDYEPESGIVPVYVLGEAEARVVEQVEGKKFKQAYRSSRVGQAIMVTFTSPSGRGWFKLRWELDEERVRRF